MIDPEGTEQSSPIPESNIPGAERSGVPAVSSDLPLNPASESEPAPKLTTEEQMALYEDYLKENDWGHQPC
jgi:hypothetical protein